MIGTALFSVLLVACGRSDAPPKPTAPVSVATTWVKDVRPWYCAAPSAELPGGAAVKMAPTVDSLTAIYTTGEGRGKRIGTLTRFAGTADRTATVRWATDRKGEKGGDAKLTFSPDFASVTITWTGTTPDAATLTAVDDPATCAAASTIR